MNDFKLFNYFKEISENRGQIEPFRGQRTNFNNRGQSSEKPSRWSAYLYATRYLII